MKKVLSIVLAIAMIATMSAVAFAADTSPVTLTGEGTFTGGSAEIAVNGTYTEGENARINNYKVTVEWEAFNYTFTNGKYWDVNDLEWKQNEGEGVWSGPETQDITVTNYSSLPVNVKAAYEGVGAFEFGDAGTEAGLTVAKADTGADVGTAQVAKIAAAFDLDTTDTIEETAVMGTITLTIA